MTALAISQTAGWGILYYAFAVIQVPMRAELGLSSASTAAAFSIAVLVTGVAAVPAGWWLDRVGARGLMTVGSIGAVLLVVAWSRVQNVAQLYLVFVGLGLVSAAVLYEPAFAVVVRWFHHARARALLVITLVAGFASTIFLPTAGALVDAVGWRDALLILAGILVVTTVIPHALVLRNDPADLGLHPDGATRLAPSVQPAEGVRSERAPRRLRATARWAARDPVFGWLTLAFAANALAVIVVVVHLFPYLREQGHSAAFAATATGALGAMSVLGRVVVTVVSRHRSTTSVVAAAFATQAVAVIILLAGGSTPVAATAFVVLFGLGFGVATIARPAIYADAYGTADYATLSALGGVAATAAKTIGPVAAGLLHTVSGSYVPVLVALTAVCAVAAWSLGRAGVMLVQGTIRA